VARAHALARRLDAGHAFWADAGAEGAHAFAVPPGRYSLATGPRRRFGAADDWTAVTVRPGEPAEVVLTLGDE